MKTEWHKQTRQRVDSIVITDCQVFVGTDKGFGHGISGAAARIPEFLAGKPNDLIEQTFGHETLLEVRQVVSNAA